MISPGDLSLFHFVETAEEAWDVLEPSTTASTCRETTTGDFADDI